MASQYCASSARYDVGATPALRACPSSLPSVGTSVCRSGCKPPVPCAASRLTSGRFRYRSYSAARAGAGSSADAATSIVDNTSSTVRLILVMRSPENVV